MACFWVLMSLLYLPQMMMQLVKSSWILHLSCNKRRIAPIAALLSAILHPSIFLNLELHQENEKGPGPLKWVSSNICFLLLHCFYCETFLLFFLSVGIKNDYLLLLLSVHALLILVK
jgi:hypothetical protein